MLKYAILGWCSLLACLLSSCLVNVENPITADVELDEQLVGVWKPVWRSEDELGDPELPRTLEDSGMNEMIVVGKTEDGFLKCVLIDDFHSRGFGATAELIGKTRSHKGKNFVLAELQSPDQADQPDRSKTHVVVEYEFNGDGDLFLYGIHDGMFDKERKLPDLEHRVDRVPFGPSFAELVSITADPDRLLDWLVDAKVSGQLLSLGKYRRMILPPGNSPSIKEPSPTE